MKSLSGELFHSDGSRKYLTREERTAFLEASRRFPCDVETFCHVLAYSGCRLAEALALTADRVDLKTHNLTFETLKKRKRGVYRAVPVPPSWPLCSIMSTTCDAPSAVRTEAVTCTYGDGPR